MDSDDNVSKTENTHAQARMIFLAVMLLAFVWGGLFIALPRSPVNRVLYKTCKRIYKSRSDTDKWAVTPIVTRIFHPAIWVLHYEIFLCGLPRRFSVILRLSLCERCAGRRFDRTALGNGCWRRRFGGPTYPGADDATTQALFVPFVIYRGEVFSIGEESGARALAFANEKIELDVSIGASLAADASEDDDREGMPDLDFLFEIGPQIIYHAAKHNYDYWTGHFDIKLRTRAVIGTDFHSFDEQGYIVEPAFVYEFKSKRDSQLEVQFDIEILNGASAEQYLHNVEAQYATAANVMPMRVISARS